PLTSPLARQLARVANKRLTPRLSLWMQYLQKSEGGGVVMVNQKSPRGPVAHPFRGEVSVSRSACRSLLSACGRRRRASFQSVPPSRWASAPAPNRPWKRIRGQSEHAYHC